MRDIPAKFFFCQDNVVVTIYHMNLCLFPPKLYPCTDQHLPLRVEWDHEIFHSGPQFSLISWPEKYISEHANHLKLIILWKYQNN